MTSAEEPAQDLVYIVGQQAIELRRLQAWKESALTELGRYHAVTERVIAVHGKPSPLGMSIAAVAQARLDDIVRLVERCAPTSPTVDAALEAVAQLRSSAADDFFGTSTERLEERVRLLTEANDNQSARLAQALATFGQLIDIFDGRAEVATRGSLDALAGVWQEAAGSVYRARDELTGTWTTAEDRAKAAADAALGDDDYLGA